MEQVSPEEINDLAVYLRRHCRPVKTRWVVEHLAEQAGKARRQGREHRAMGRSGHVGDHFAGRASLLHPVAVKARDQRAILLCRNQPQRHARRGERGHVEAGG